MYVTLPEAELIVEKYFMSTSIARGYWDALEESDKLVALNKGFRAIELLPYTGRTTEARQEKAFPRWPDREVPSAVRDAQVLVAVALADPTIEREQARYKRMKAVGVRSYRIGRYAERLTDDDISTIDIALSSEAKSLLQPWLDGSFRVV